MNVYGEDFRLAICEVLENRAIGQPTPRLYWIWSNHWLHEIKNLLQALANDGVEVYTDFEPVTNNTIFREVRYETPAIVTASCSQLGYRRPISIAQCGVQLRVFNFPDEQVFNILAMLTKKLYDGEQIPKDIREAMRRGDLEW